MKKQEGISLVSLIITVVLLLIISAITIQQVNNDGIIDKAKEAKEEYERIATEEEDKLQELMNEIQNIR